MKKLGLGKYRFLVLILLICLSFCISSCNKKNNNNKVDNNNPTGEIKPPVDETPAKVTKTSWFILENSASKTAVYKYVTDKKGPKIAIVGGIHGDETAGWNAALSLVDKIENEKGICGEILLIPQANILADKAQSRYKVTGYVFSDLNRSFPKDREEGAKQATIKISDALRETVEAFDPDYVIDLHESRTSYTKKDSGLGDTIIASNSTRKVKQIIKNYNENYRFQDETEFRQEYSYQKGSFNYYFTNTYSDKMVMTIETNRDYRNNTNHINLETRVRQQLNVLEAIFDYAWNRTK